MQQPYWAEYRSEVWVTLRLWVVDMAPSGSESSTVEFTESGQHSIGIALRPASTRATHAMLDDVVAPALHRATPNRVAFCSKLVISHARQVGLKVAGGLTYLIRNLTLVQVEGSQVADDRPALALPQIVETFSHPLLALLAALAVQGLTLCWLLNSSTRVPCAEIAEMRYHAVLSTI